MSKSSRKKRTQRPQAAQRTWLIPGLAIVIGAVALPPPANDNSGHKPEPPGIGRITPDTPLASLAKRQREQLLKAMARMEGWRRGTTSFNNLNPGNLNFGKFAQSHGATKGPHGLAKFESCDKAWEAMDDLVFRAYRRRTIGTMLAGDPAKHISGYAPAVRDQFQKTGKPDLYAKNVAKWMNEMAENPAAEEQYANICPVKKAE